MRLNLEHLDAYEILEHRMIEDIHAEGMLLVHKKSGARICLASNDDENKVFYIGFRTPPKDSTGVAHIIEHTVLCGSEKFPVKDPFIELVKGSLNTFLNAMTYPDKTVYPVASCNDEDFKNLMDVYMDSVLHPNIYKEQNIFRQEGWHYELEDPEGEVTINGVVYNEMKGAFSSPDSVLDREILNALYPDTPYGNESGGDPEVIPSLTYEDYLDFHRTYYHPVNSYIYIYGNADMEERLTWLDQQYLKNYNAFEMDSALPLQPAFAEPRKVEKYYSISSNDSEEDQTYLSMNWAIGTNLDKEQYIAFDVLDYALLSSQGAPIKKALLDAGIGNDIYGGYDSGTYQPSFSVVAKNTNPSRQEEFVRIIRETLEKLVKDGLNRKTLLAALNGSEFKFREADFGRFPKGLMFGLQLLDSWLYDEKQPFLHMEALGVFESLRQKLDSGYFEQLIQTYLLDNPHCVLVNILPKKGLTGQKEQALKEQLAAYKESLTPEEVQALVDQTAALKAYQEEPSTPEELETIKLLSIDDLKKVSDPYKNEELSMAGVPCLWHDYDTNGIVYLDFMFDVHHVKEEDIPYLSILRTLLGKLDNGTYSYTDFADEINLYTGGISSEVNVWANIEKDPEYLSRFEVRLKSLESNVAKAVELACSMLFSTSFADEKRIYEVLSQTRSRTRTELSESGHTVALCRAMSYYSAKARFGDLFQGIEGYRVLSQVVDHFDEEKEKLISRLQDLMKSILQQSKLMINVTCEKKSLSVVEESAGRLIGQLYPDTEDVSCDVSLPTVVNEGFMDASQIQYVAMAGDFSKEGLAYRGALRVFKVIMSYDYLWQNIRVKGGAYGCACNAGRRGDMYFTSYRDPNLGRTLDVYRGVSDYLRSFEADERTMTRYIIGTCSEMDMPLNPIAKGRRSLGGYLTGLTVEMLQQTRDEVLSTTPEDIRGLAELVDAAKAHSYYCAVGNEEKIKEEAELFEHVENLA